MICNVFSGTLNPPQCITLGGRINEVSSPPQKLSRGFAYSRCLVKYTTVVVMRRQSPCNSTIFLQYYANQVLRCISGA